MEQYDDGLLTPGPSTLNQHDGRNQDDSPSSDLEQHALDEQLARKQLSDASRGSRDLSATQIEGYIPDRHQNNALRRRNLDLDTDNIIEGPRRTRRTADYQEPGRWHTHAILCGQSIHRTQVPAAPRSYRELDHHQFGEQFRHATQREYHKIWGKSCFAETTFTAKTACAEVLPLILNERHLRVQWRSTN